MTEQQQFDVATLTPERFADLVTGASDAQIAQTLHAAGTKSVLDRVFDGMQQRFLPEKAAGVDAVVRFVITDDGTEYPYAVTIADGTCRIADERRDDPKITITTDAVSFLKLVAGTANGPQLFMSGKLKVAGDVLFSQRVMRFFQRIR